VCAELALRLQHDHLASSERERARRGETYHPPADDRYAGHAYSLGTSTDTENAGNTCSNTFASPVTVPAAAGTGEAPVSA
jgi:hypothetical protein